MAVSLKSKFVKVDIISKMWTSFTFDQFKFREHNDLMLCVVLQGHAGLAAQGTAVHGGLQVTWPRGQDQEDKTSFSVRACLVHA